jgi:hypothetical protein
MAVGQSAASRRLGWDGNAPSHTGARGISHSRGSAIIPAVSLTGAGFVNAARCSCSSAAWSLPASYLRFKLNRPQRLCDERKLVNARSRIFRASQIESLLLNRAVRRHGLPHPSTNREAVPSIRRRATPSPERGVGYSGLSAFQATPVVSFLASGTLKDRRCLGLLPKDLLVQDGSDGLEPR